MWEFSNHSGKDWSFVAPSVASCHSGTPEIHVLLVEHDSNSLVSTIELTEMCHYRVTFVELASAAVSILLNAKAKFDVVLADINSPDLHGYKLLELSTDMGIPVVLMSNEDNELSAMKALEMGALLYIEKPVTLEMMKSLWQHVLREKIRARRKGETSGQAGRHGSTVRTVQLCKEEKPSDHYNVDGGNVALLKKKREYKEMNEVRHECHHKVCVLEKHVKGKMCTEWTPELHQKFIAAVRKLGEGRCFPKDILELMNVPGLTRMQVASHLQKCRNHNWNLAKERKPHQSGAADASNFLDRPRKFGCMPQLEKNNRNDPGRRRLGSESDPKQNMDLERPRSTMNNPNSNLAQARPGLDIFNSPELKPGARFKIFKF